MWKKLSISIAISGTLACPAFAQFDFSQPAGGSAIYPGTPQAAQGNAMYPGTPQAAQGNAMYPGTPQAAQGNAMYPGTPQAAQGNSGNQSALTGTQGPGGGSMGGSPSLPPTYLGQLAQPKGLPPTRLDSLVKASGYNDQIYGDEGTYGPPPYFDFQYIEEGLPGGLTTGHQSSLPSAWGTPY